MTPNFLPSLVNCPFDDPALYVDFLHERRALLFDLGDIAALPHRKILRISHVFISHTHVDHFIGFDHLVRLSLGRALRTTLFGPPGFVEQVGHRLAGYTWNLVSNYPYDFVVTAVEVRPDGSGRSADFRCRDAFRPGDETPRLFPGGLLLDEETFRVRCEFLDHRIPSMAYALEEKNHVSIMKNRLDEMGLVTGPWLAELKRAVLRGEPDDLPVRASAVEGERTIPLGELRERALLVVPGQKIAYVADTAPTEANDRRIVSLAAGADYLFIESPFPEVDAERAAERSHLTARRAGRLAREAGVARVEPFHFSPRYQDREEMLREEIRTAFRGE
jgi:ribonuclease Z